MKKMKITIEDRGTSVLRDRLRDRLERASLLRCALHDRSADSVVIHGRENGWFDSTWSTCCEELERQVSAIVKQRC
jgi:hypothetical protein